MSIVISNTSIKYGDISIITISNLTNVSITPNNSVINTEINYSSNITTYTVKPELSTLYYITGYDLYGNIINLNGTVYVNITLLNDTIIIPYNTSQELTAYGSNTYKWSPTTYLNNNINTSSVICTPLEDITYTIIGKDSFNTISKVYLKIIVNNYLEFTPSNPTVYDGDLLNLSVYYNGPIPTNNNNNNTSISTEIENINSDLLNEISDLNIISYINENTVNENTVNENIDTIKYVWKSRLFNTLPQRCIYYKYGNSIKLHPYYSTEYNVKVYYNNTILTSGNIIINVIQKPMNIIDIDILPYILYKSIISRDEKSLIKQLNQNKDLVTKIINFYYTTLQSAYRMEWTNKSGISFSVKWNTLYQIKNESNEMILNFNQQWNFFKYINSHQKRNNITTSNFVFLLNTINKIYLEYPQKIGIYPLLS